MDHTLEVEYKEEGKSSYHIVHEFGNFVSHLAGTNRIRRLTFK